MLAVDNISKLGFGTWGIGGFAEPDPDNDDARDIAGIKYWLSKGINYVEAPLWYAKGKTAELVAQAIRESGVPREQLFIVFTVHAYQLPGPREIQTEYERFCKMFDTDYADALKMSMGGIKQWGTDKTFKVVENFLAAGKARYFNLSNADLSFLRQTHKRFGDQLFGHELHLNFEIRVNDDLGVVAFADQHHIRNIIAQPIRRNRTAAHNWPLLVELSKKYRTSQNQVVIAWLVANDMLPIPKSTNPQHIDELIGSLDIQLTGKDIARLNAWRPTGYTPPRIDWARTLDPANGVAIDQLANVFDDNWAK